ncbi:uncharacterized protein LOC130303808 [Hyla sarda]|uniref:uncharacterized protein LOC130303808 n=1 Tax=Hyla sarda TaxID=327740 RepID=UPI0024C3C200|nr:uncharacterized protein LOC130303808 [Hyla sarda]XP_056407824.1 uncharacterized protein LOC130303808 [Hyla sarda]
MANSLLAGGFDTSLWLEEAKEVFSEKELSHSSHLTPTLNSVFKELNYRYKNQIKSWWEVQSLDNYISNRIVPKGLRIAISPALRSRTPTLMSKWEKEATESSLRFMNLLLEEERNTLDSTTKKLQESIDIALKLKQDPEFAKKDTELKNNIEKFKHSLKDRKHKQFIRDLNDFRDNKAYNFLNQQPYQGTETEISSSETDASDSERPNYQSWNRSPYSTRYRGAYRGNNRGWGKKSRPRGSSTKRGNSGETQGSGSQSFSVPSVPSGPTSSSTTSGFLVKDTQVPPRM